MKAQSLTVLGGSVSKHGPQVTAAHVFDGNCHLGGAREKSGELDGLHMWKKCYMQGDFCEWPPEKINPLCGATVNPFEEENMRCSAGSGTRGSLT